MKIKTKAKVHSIQFLSSTAQKGRDGRVLKLKRLANVFNFGCDVYFQEIPKISIAFPGVIHLILSFWFIRNVVAFESSTANPQLLIVDLDNIWIMENMNI